MVNAGVCNLPGTYYLPANDLVSRAVGGVSAEVIRP